MSRMDKRIEEISRELLINQYVQVVLDRTMHLLCTIQIPFARAIRIATVLDDEFGTRKLEVESQNWNERGH